MTTPAKAEAPKDVLTTKATTATQCRGRWSQCGGKFQQVSESWHICHADSALRDAAMASGQTMRGGKLVTPASPVKPAAQPPAKGLSAAKAGKAAKAPKAASTETSEVPAERSHKPPQSVLSTPVSRVSGSPNAAAAQLLNVKS